jgi:ceramide glucosyltransferase
MMYTVLDAIQIAAAAGIISSSLYYILCIGSATAFLRKVRESRSETSFSPPISILKPLKGIDPGIYESFRSHCLLDYPEYEIIFGVSDPSDPAIEIVRKVQHEFPDRRIQLVVCQKILGANVKVSNLVQMLPEARYEYLVVNDSDIRVEPDYLLRETAPLADSRVGMVTCLYRGVASKTLGSRLEALGISTDFCASVLVARQIERGIRFGLGSTMAFRRSELEKIGGFTAILDFLADDYELGKRISNCGLSIELSELVVETHLPPYRLRDLVSHQLRWARGVRDVRKGGYIGLIFTFGLTWALLAIIVSQGAKWAVVALAMTLLLRFAAAFAVGWKVLRDRQLFRSAWLIPLRDVIATVVWLVSLVGNSVTWRGDRFRLKNGRLKRIPD